jgi:hypothetical protein
VSVNLQRIESIGPTKGEEVAMRIRIAFLSCAILAGVLWVADGAVAQTEPPPPPPTSCWTGSFSAEVTGGPTVVSCSESSTGQCTEIEYTVSADFKGSTDHVFVLEGLGVAYVKDATGVCSPSPCKISDPCEGDKLSGIGRLACHEQAARIDPNDAKSTTFTVGLVGQRSASPTSIAVKKGKGIDACRILGIGLDGTPNENPFKTITTRVEQQFGECKYEVETDAATGDSTCLITGGPPTCECKTVALADVEVTVDGEGGKVLFSEEVAFVVEGSYCSWRQYYPTRGPWIRVCY